MAGTPRYRVAAGTQVHHAGTTYAAGELVPLDEKLDRASVDELLNAGWLETADGSPAPAPRRKRETKKAQPGAVVRVGPGTPEPPT